MDGMRPPQLPDQPIDVVRPEHLARLLKTCGACSRQPCPLVSADRLETQVDATRLAVCQHAKDQARGGCGPGPEATESASLSEIDGRALCYPASSQVAPIRKCHKNGVNWRSSAPAA
jgi:hypothetical protein